MAVRRQGRGRAPEDGRDEQGAVCRVSCALGPAFPSSSLCNRPDSAPAPRWPRAFSLLALRCTIAHRAVLQPAACSPPAHGPRISFASLGARQLAAFRIERERGKAKSGSQIARIERFRREAGGLGSRNTSRRDSGKKYQQSAKETQSQELLLPCRHRLLSCNALPPSQRQPSLTLGLHSKNVKKSQAGLCIPASPPSCHRCNLVLDAVMAGMAVMAVMGVTVCVISRRPAE